ncbi:rolling circle replication-associated protein [Lachnoclostridium phytofermentans]|uniref:rolling circle replication-associated protein n=1 Tax=Lachnoclostridium phytofermentans TaxID=66219 RepID=UPI000497984A|nr:hypothetical protein [Lachnoclostridium phytofermentans]
MLVKYKDYDYEEIYDISVLGKEEQEERIERLRRGKVKYKYKLKTIVSGKMVESELYPVYEKSCEVPRKDKEKESKESMKNLNDKNARKQIVRLVNTNFSEKDLMVTLTYTDRTYPTEKRAKQDMQNYIRRVKTYRKKHGLPDMKYIYVIEFLEPEEAARTRKIRIHHHIIMSGMDRDAAEDLWKKGRVEAKRLQPDDFGLEGIATYLIKGKKGKKRWYSSRNLKKPKVYEAVTRVTKRKAEKMALQPDKWREMFEKLYRDKYIMNDCEVFYSDIVGGFYLRARMRLLI